MKRLPLGAAVFAMILGNHAAFAQSREPGGMPPPDGMSLAQSAAMRFPQAVRVGDLIGRSVLEPVVTRRVLGTVKQVVRAANGTLSMIVDYGGFFGFGARPIAVPVDATVLLGAEVEVVAYKPDDLAKLPTFADNGATPLAADSSIKVGLAKPSH
jgi:hypothetical protein